MATSSPGALWLVRHGDGQGRGFAHCWAAGVQLAGASTLTLLPAGCSSVALSWLRCGSELSA
eukprot:11314399-Alexandrium_andersonii.AAC.1